MSIEDEKATVRALHAGGMTIHEISAHVGRSASCVYTRLRDDHAPKRTRDTADVAPEPIEDISTNAVLRAELEEVRRLRKSGLTYEQIAEALGRSIYWVHSRLKGGYQPAGSRTERRFQEQAVVPYLLDAGHMIVAQCERPVYGRLVLEADIVSRFNNETWITEVKVGADGHEIHTAIGQLVLHSALRQDGKDLRLQIAVPAGARPPRFDDAVLAAVRLSVRIEFAFIPWDRPGLMTG
jgi:hypothetical protein